MAFTFQINNDVKFKHDEKLLAKAEASAREKSKERTPPGHGSLKVIERSIEIKMDVGVTESDKSIDKIEEYGLKRMIK